MKLFKKILKNPLLKGSFILFVGTNIVNFGSYLYHLLLGRLLGPTEYGVLVSLISLMYIVSVFSTTLSAVVVKFAASYKAKNNYGKIFSLFYQFSKKFLILGAVLFLGFILINKPLVSFLNIKTYQKELLLLGTTFLIRFLVPVNNGLLQGLQNFFFLSFWGILAVILRLGIGLVLVKAGFSILGAVIGLVLSEYLPFLISFFPLRFLTRYKEKAASIEWKSPLIYAVPAFITVFSLNSLFTTDIILVKHFFSSYQAGLYSALGMMGKVVYFASLAVTTVMFPLVAEKYENNGKYKDILYQALILVGLVSVGITSVYFLWPNLMVGILYGSSYLEIASVLGPFGIFISIYCLNNVLATFFLSIHQKTASFLTLGAAALQVILIGFFHKSLLQIIQLSILVSALLLISLLLYYARSEKS